MKTKNINVTKGSGRVGATLNRVLHGVQIQGAMPAKMTNPKTEAQVDNRARFKLMSQLSAAMADVIAIPRSGNVSGRNQFVTKNYDLISYDGNTAEIELASVQLTNSQRSLGVMSVTRGANERQGIFITTTTTPGRYDKLVTIVFQKNSDNTLDLMANQIDDVAASGTTNIQVEEVWGSLVIYQYGINYKSAAASSKYGNIQTDPAKRIAELATTSKTFFSNADLSKTAGVDLIAEQSTGHGGSILTVPGLYMRPLGASNARCLVNSQGGIVSDSATPTSGDLCLVYTGGHWACQEIGTLPTTNASGDLPNGVNPGSTQDFQLNGYYFDNIGQGSWNNSPKIPIFPES